METYLVEFTAQQLDTIWKVMNCVKESLEDINIPNAKEPLYKINSVLSKIPDNIYLKNIK